MSSNVIKGKRFLILDDEQAMLEIVSAVLTSFGAEPVGVTSPQKFSEMSRRGSFDFIILDRHLPDGDGNEILKELKSIPSTKNIPVIMLTGETRAEEIQASIKLGAVGYIAKPFKAKDFLMQIMHIVQSNQFNVK